MVGNGEDAETRRELAGGVFKTKNISELILKYAQQIDSQAERQTRLISTAVSARTVETTSNVRIIEPLRMSATLPPRLYKMNKELIELSEYVAIDVNSYMSGLVGWQRCTLYLAVFCMIVC